MNWLQRLKTKVMAQSSQRTQPLVRTPWGLARTIAQLGLPQYGITEFMSELDPPEGLHQFHKMERNDPVIGGMLLRLKSVFSRVRWSFEGDSAPALGEVLTPLMPSLLKMLASSLTYGFAVGEMVFTTSEGRVVLRDVLPLWQPSIMRFEDNTIIQLTQVDGILKIPRSKCVHHVFVDENRSPWGVSILRHVYKPYYYKINAEAAEATAIDRDLSGLPVLTAPEGFDFAAADPSSPSYNEAVAATLDWAVQLVSNVRKDSQQGAVIPAGWTLNLLRSSGTPSINPTETIQRYNSEIAAGLLEGFALLGTTTSRASAEVLLEDFFNACSGFVANMEETINSQVVAKLRALNDLPPGRVSLVPPKAFDLSKLASFVARLVAQGVITPTTELEHALLSFAELPKGEDEKPVKEEG